MCRGSSAPGRRTTFNGKSGMRSGRMGPRPNDTRGAGRCMAWPGRYSDGIPGPVTNTPVASLLKCDRFYRQMQFVVQSHRVGGVAVIHCEGRLVVSDAVRALQEEVEKHSLETKNYVLDLGAVSYLDSGALGALVRLVGALRAYRGDLKLCQVPPSCKTSCAPRTSTACSASMTRKKTLSQTSRGGRYPSNRRRGPRTPGSCA